MTPQERDEKFEEFLEGFCDATGVSHFRAREHWNKFAKGYSDRDREYLECEGYYSGRAQGLYWWDTMRK